MTAILIPTYEHARVKFNGGRGALLCNFCGVILKYGFLHEDRVNRCYDCRKVETPGPKGDNYD